MKLFFATLNIIGYGLCIKQELKEFSDDDYLLLIGDPAIIAVCGAIAAKNNRGKFKVLKWDRNDKRYYDLEIDLRG
mgnify:CR=1 FL=1